MTDYDDDPVTPSTATPEQMMEALRWLKEQHLLRTVITCGGLDDGGPIPDRTPIGTVEQIEQMVGKLNVGVDLPGYVTAPMAYHGERPYRAVYPGLPASEFERMADRFNAASAANGWANLHDSSCQGRVCLNPEHVCDDAPVIDVTPEE